MRGFRRNRGPTGDPPPLDTPVPSRRKSQPPFPFVYRRAVARLRPPTDSSRRPAEPGPQPYGLEEATRRGRGPQRGKVEWRNQELPQEPVRQGGPLSVPGGRRQIQSGGAGVPEFAILIDRLRQGGEAGMKGTR